MRYLINDKIKIDKFADGDVIVYFDKDMHILNATAYEILNTIIDNDIEKARDIFLNKYLNRNTRNNLLADFNNVLEMLKTTQIIIRRNNNG